MATKKKRKTSKKKFVKKLKNACNNLKIEFLRTWKRDPVSILVPEIGRAHV